MARMIAFSNQKGGVGKTTSCVSIASQLGKLGKKVLLVDYDPQGNATSGVGIDKRSLRATVYDVIARGASPKSVILPTKFENLWVLPSKTDLAAAEIELSGAFDKENNPLSALKEVKYDYDYILIDCPPSLGFLTLTALSLSDGVVVPLQCEFFALEGLSQLLPSIRRIRQLYNPGLRLVGILPTMYNGRLTLTRQVIEEIKQYYPSKLFKTPISRSVRLSEAPGFGMPIQYLDPRGKSTAEYADVTAELLERI